MSITNQSSTKQSSTKQSSTKQSSTKHTSSTKQQKHTIRADVSLVLVSAYFGLRFRVNFHLNQRYYDDSNEDVDLSDETYYEEYVPKGKKTRNASNGRQKWG